MSPRDFDFEGSGHKGAAFEQKGREERNIANLLAIFGNAEANKTLTELSKIKKDQWKSMGETLGVLKDFMDTGGISFFDRIEETWSLQVQNALSPLLNEINELVATALKPIMPLIMATLNEATDWIKVAVGSWEAVFTGEWDEVLKDIEAKMPDWFKEWKNLFQDTLWKFLEKILKPFWEATLAPATQATASWLADFWHSLGWI